MATRASGIDCTRLPKFSWGSGAKKLRRYLAKAGPVAEPAAKVVYFLDLHACYHDHALARAAVDVLRHNGIEVAVPPQRWSAEAAIACGAIETARRAIRYNLAQVAPYVRDGYCIVCSDPTTAVTIRMDWQAVERSDEAAAVAEATCDLTAYLASLQQDGKLRACGRSLDLSLAYHAPVHVKALHARRPGLDLAAAIPGVNVEDIGGGTCGMSGACGLLKRNTGLSLSMGEDVLERFRSMDAPYGLTECSTCKMQMESATGKPVLHPVKLLAAGYGYPVRGMPA
jgi:Fe-S oxidoreductase